MLITSAALSQNEELPLSVVSPTSGSVNHHNHHHGNHNSTMSVTNRQERTGYRVWLMRYLFLAVLAVVAAMLSFAANRILRNAEQKLAEQQFAAIADRALDTAAEVTVRKRLAAKSLATAAAHLFPDATQWPYVVIPGFAQLATSVIETAAAGTMGLAVRVKPNQQDSFLEYIHEEVWTSQGDQWLDYQERITSFDASAGFARYNETTGAVRGWNSTSTDLWPYSMHSFTTDILLYNLHSLERFGQPIDDMEACVKSQEKDVPTVLDLTTCAIMTDIVIGFNADGSVRGPAAFVYQPIYPANDADQLVGFITSALDWGDAVKNLFTAEVSGVDCVLSTETTSFTYHVTAGVAMEKGYGDFHDPDFTHLGTAISLNSPDLFSSNLSTNYTLTVYPSEEFIETYRTDNPKVALVGALGIVLFMTVLYLLYDNSVRQEFRHKVMIMRAKRQFMRFISHEVRTPLNAVVMGSNLVQDDMIRVAKELEESTKKKTKCTPYPDMQYSSNDAPQQSQDNKEPDHDDGTEISNQLIVWSELAEEILNNAKSAVGVLNDLLQYDKIESGTLSLELSYVPIWSLINNVTKEFTLSSSAKSIAFQVDFSGLFVNKADVEGIDGDDEEVGRTGLPDRLKDKWVIGDKIRIAQVLRNLLSNAIKFTPEGGNVTASVFYYPPARPHEIALDSENNKNGGDKCTPKRSFTLSTGKQCSLSPSGTVRVHVTDSGAGMTAEQVATVFKEGVQFNVNELQAGQGSGLGLYIAYGIAAQHGGNLTVTSRGLGKGTTFVMELPLYHVPETQIPEGLLRARNDFDSHHRHRHHSDRGGILSVANSGGSEQTPALENMQILVVDDILSNRKLLMRLLVNRGHECHGASDGAQAVEQVKQAMHSGKRFDVVLLDHEMPVMTGPEAALILRKLGCDSVIVGITGNTLPEDVSYFKSQGANHVLAKPLDIAALEEILAFGA